MPFNPILWPFRLQFLLGALCCAGLLGYALYAQYQLFLEPCPLCMMQRYALGLVGIGFLFGAIHGPKSRVGRGAYSGIVWVGVLAGVLVAGRHLWLQSLPPDQVPACGPGLDYLLDAFPLKDALMKVFAGSGECAKVDWSFLGIAMPGWTLIWFILLGAWAMQAALRKS